MKERFYLKKILVLMIFFICSSYIFTSNITEENKSTGNPHTVLGFRPFPDDNPWNTKISEFPIHPNSQNFIKAIGENISLKPDFGTFWNGVPNGIPYIIVDSDQQKSNVFYESMDNMDAYDRESDHGFFPIPDNVPIEGGEKSTKDRRVIVIDRDAKMLYELYYARKVKNGWKALSGAIFDLNSNLMREKRFISADSAGLPIFPGLVRYEEIENGEINHALRFTVPNTQNGFIFPARHFVSESNNPNFPPMGLRVRLKSSVNISMYSKKNQIILKALKEYGMFVADNGRPWHLSGAPDSRWNDEEIQQLSNITGNDFEVVDTGEIER